MGRELQHVDRLFLEYVLHMPWEGIEVLSFSFPPFFFLFFSEALGKGCKQNAH